MRMVDWLESGSRRHVGGGSSGGWRIPASAWLIAIAFAVLFAGIHALASRDRISPRGGDLAGAVIPQHDQALPGPDEVAASDWLERAKADAYTGW